MGSSSHSITLSLGSQYNYYPKHIGVSLNNLSSNAKQGAWAKSKAADPRVHTVIFNIRPGVSSSTTLNSTFQRQPRADPCLPGYREPPQTAISLATPVTGSTRERHRLWQLTLSVTSKNTFKESISTKASLSWSLLNFHSGRHFWKQLFWQVLLEKQFSGTFIVLDISWHRTNSLAI